MRHPSPSRHTNALLRSIAPLVMTAAIVVAGCGKTEVVTDPLQGAFTEAGPLLNSVTSAVPGLSHAQSALGVGSLLGLAKAKMPANQFSEVSAAIPGSAGLVDNATKEGLPANVGRLADVTSFLIQSGISSGQVGLMIPVVTNAVSDKVSPEVAAAFKSVLW